MAVCNLRDLKPLLAPGGRLIGLDLGEKTIGMAVSDPGLSLASPIGTGPVRCTIATCAMSWRSCRASAIRRISCSAISG